MPMWRVGGVSETDLKQTLHALFGSPRMDELIAGATQANKIEERINCYVAEYVTEIQNAFGQLGGTVAERMRVIRTQQRKCLEALKRSSLPEDAKQLLLERYIGFGYWDAILYPLLALSGIGEPDPVKVFRISSQDTTRLQPLGVQQRLKGIGAFHFGAFFKRAYREKDFLWGRLDGVERLTALVHDLAKTTTEAKVAKKDQTWDDFTWHGFDAVLKSETLNEQSARALAQRLEAQVSAKVRNSGPQT
jgi:hypothetical protein